MLSSKLQHALMFLNEVKTSDTPISSQSIAEKYRLSLSFLEQICRQLRIAGIVKSIRGPGGGFVKGDNFNNATLFSVSRAIGTTETKFILTDNYLLNEYDANIRAALVDIKI